VSVKKMCTRPGQIDRFLSDNYRESSTSTGQHANDELWVDEGPKHPNLNRSNDGWFFVVMQPTIHFEPRGHKSKQNR
jgi:hypothetical protein